MRRRQLFLICFVMPAIMSACTTRRAPLGSEKNPLKLFFVPSVDAKILEDKSRLIKAQLEKLTPYKVQVSIPTSYVAVIEALGTKRADVASLNTFGYVMAHQKYGAQARLIIVRYGMEDYKGAIFARADGKIKSINDIQGKKFAYVDPASTSGYLLPLKLFKDKNIKPSQTVFAQKHDNVISMIYQKQVDAGAAYYLPPHAGEIEDARRLVLKQYPDVEKKVKIIDYTDSILNDPIVFRKDVPEEMKAKLIHAMLAMMNTPEGKDAFWNIHGATALKPCTDKEYESVRALLSHLGTLEQNN